jgi:hypothetical protein
MPRLLLLSFYIKALLLKLIDKPSVDRSEKHEKLRMWTTSWISTGALVEKPGSGVDVFCCPEVVRRGYNACSTGFKARKPLIFRLLTALSTENCRFTIYYYVFYIFIL